MPTAIKEPSKVKTQVSVKTLPKKTSKTKTKTDTSVKTKQATTKVKPQKEASATAKATASTKKGISSDSLKKKATRSPKLSETASKAQVKEKSMHNKDLGRKGEEAAARFLAQRGYDILERNWKCRFGEADIIARDELAVVFVEVKTRTSIEKGLPSQAVNAEKRAKYEKIAAAFLKEFDVSDVPVRFDIVSLLVVSPHRAMVRHHINAFA